MNTITPQQRREKLWSLPESDREVVVGIETVQIFDEMVKKYSLSKEQSRILGSNLNLTLLGFISVKNLEQVIISELKIDSVKAQKLIEDLKISLLNKISNLKIEDKKEILETEQTKDVSIQKLEKRINQKPTIREKLKRAINENDLKN